MGVSLPPHIAAAIHAGATLLAPTQRAARTLRRAWDDAQAAAGLTLWHPPPIFELGTWLSTLHQALLLQGHETRILLNRAQQHALWRSVISITFQQDAAPAALRSPESLADLAARAFRLLHLYRGSVNAREFALATDTRAFERWFQAFERLCNREGFLPEAQLPAVLHEALAQGTLPVPDSLVLVDFDTLPPAHALLFTSIKAAGYAVERLQTTSEPASAELHTASDDAAELRAAALWVRRQLTLNPDAHIAVVVPALSNRRAAIERVFAEIVAPELQSIVQREAPLPYEFSLGIPLAATALVAAALPLLRWPAEPLPTSAISALLLSPAFGASAGPTAAETLAAARFDAHELPRFQLLRPELSLEAFIAFSAQARHPLALSHALRRTLRTAAEAPGRQSHAAWADHFRALLEAAQWAPGWSSARNSLDFEILARWESVLDELATLDFSGPVPTRAEALDALTRLAHQTIFAPESRGTPVQILGPLELGGLPFDALWFLGADDLAWPAPASPSPLLPFALQRALGMPATDAASEAAEARALTTRIAQSAAQVVFSYSQESGEGFRHPSPALAPLGLTPYLPPPEPPAPAPLSLAAIEETSTLPPLPDRVFPGGARVLELQAACPFRAFAELRLHAGQPETRTPGLDARDRGQLVHTIMELFWDEASTQENLRQLGEPARSTLLDRSIDAALEEAQALSSSPWDAAYLEVQRLRLQQLLRPWLEKELDRPNFAVTSHERKLHDISIGPLRLDLRVDRIDSTAGGPLILDYKTGPAAPTEWLSDRPDAPQLPLYAVVSARETGAELGGVAFANLRAGDALDLAGFAESPAVLAKPSRMEAATLADQVDQWREHLTALAQAFADGDARVDPKRYPGTCTRCSQRVLCRLDPATLTLTQNDTQLDDEDAAAPAGYGAARA